MYEFIPISERKKFKCSCCGSDLSVKYLVESADGKKVPYCNKCALKYSLGMISDRILNKGDNMRYEMCFESQG